MSISTYSELVAAVEAWFNRTDQSDNIPTAIVLFEAWANRTLRAPEMEATATAVTTAGTAELALPDDFRQARSVRLDTDPVTVLQYMTPQAMRDTYSVDIQSQPQAVSVEGLNLVLAPTPDSEYSVELAYYQSIPNLNATDNTNWLLTKHPDAYFAGTLAALNKLVRDEDAAAYWQSMADTILGVAQQEANSARVVGPMRMRPTVSE